MFLNIFNQIAACLSRSALNEGQCRINHLESAFSLLGGFFHRVGGRFLLINRLNETVFS